MKRPKKPKPEVVAREIVRKSFSALRAEHAESGVELSSEEEADDEAPSRRAKRKQRQSATAIVVETAFDASVPKRLRRKLMSGQALAATIVVPTAAWVGPMTAYVKSTFGDRWHLQTRDGSERKRDSSVGNDEVARDLSKGACVMGIAVDPNLLPTALKAAADISIRITPLDGAALRTAITRFARRSPGEMADATATALDLHELVSAFRPGTGARAIAKRLESTAASRRGGGARVPALETATEYGEARTWGLALARDVADFRAGRISWAEVDRGVCLHSAPGMGKTLFAQILANACKVPLVTTSVGAWFADGPGYLDSVLKAMRAAFARAGALASPCSILFLDEVDALPDRATLSPRGRDWWMPIITDALTLLDSAVSDRAGIVVVGATNAIDRVDEALLRPGRLEKIVEIPKPDAAGALNVARFHLNGDISEDLSPLGPLLAGRSGAEIMHAVRGARRSARQAGRALTIEDLAQAALPVEAVPPARLFRMSLHEAAHAVVALALKVGAIRHVVLRERGISGGQTVVDLDVGDLTTRRALEDRIVVSLAGRAAEIRFAGAASTGSLQQSLAGAAVEQAIALDRDLRDSVERDLRRLEARAARLVAANGAAILAVAERLAERRFVDGNEIEGIVRAHPGAARRSRRSRSNP